jgi:DNA-binding NarL/FixJ family response regulator
MIKILVADDHPIIRKGVINIISSEPDMQVAFEAATGKAVLDFVKEEFVDIVILDILLPDINGFEILRELKSTHPRLPVLMISAVAEQVYTSKSIRQGASGFISKETAHEEMVPAIRKIMAGGIYITETLVERIAANPANNPLKALHSNLSTREYQIMTLLGAGKSITEISHQLNLNAKTICSFRARILHKMGMDNNNELIRYCIDEGLI